MILAWWDWLDPVNWAKSIATAFADSIGRAALWWAGRYWHTFDDVQKPYTSITGHRYARWSQILGQRDPNDTIPALTDTYYFLETLVPVDLLLTCAAALLCACAIAVLWRAVWRFTPFTW